MSEWQPIETAPKDGSRIIVSFGTMGVWAVHWDNPHEIEVTPENGIWCVDDNKFDPHPLRGWNYNLPTSPTHWMPLPPPPKEPEPTPDTLPSKSEH